MSLLEVKHLETHFYHEKSVIKAVDGVSLYLAKGEAVGIVGESGCGKSVFAHSLLRLIPSSHGRIVGGAIMYHLPHQPNPIDLMKLPEEKMRSLRGKRMAMIFQGPMTSLNPLSTIGDQIAEAIALHEGGSRAVIRDRTLEMLQLVGIPVPEKRIDAFPHELSGGMRQRAMIAMALSCKPDILIADEPTTALDVTIQAQILELLAKLREQLGMALLLITHDLGVVAEVAHRVMVMYAGKCVEEGTVQEIFHHPKHPYTQALLRALPSFGKRGGKLPTIPGAVPSLAHLPEGCAFQDRCPKVQERCRKGAVPDDPSHVGRLVRCYYA